MFFSEKAATISYLDHGESHHAVRVLRKSNGDVIQLTDGKGTLYLVKITDPNPRKCAFEIQESRDIPSLTPHLHLAISPTKSMDRILWFVEKVVEIGVNEISFIQCQNSERTKINIEKVRSKAVSAMKQSKQCWLPKINPLVPFKVIIDNTEQGQRFIANLAEDRPQQLSGLIRKNTPSLILIGPEGDFTPEEIEQCRVQDFERVALGTTRLRTETAGIVAATLLRTSL